MISADVYFALTAAVGPPKGDPRVDLSGPTGRPVEGFFDFGSGGAQRRQKRKETDPITEKEPEPEPWPWAKGQISRLSRAQHIKYMQFHAQELMGELITDLDYKELSNAVYAEQTRFSQMFRDWSQQQSSHYYSNDLRELIRQCQVTNHNPFPLETRFSLFERINTKLLPNALTQQEPRRVTGAEIRTHMQACLGKPQIIPEEAFNELIDVSLETLLEQCNHHQGRMMNAESPLHTDPCVAALARHPNVAFAATFDGLLGLLSCARADTQANCGVEVQLRQMESGSSCVFISSTLQPPNVSSASVLRSIVKEGCLEILQHQSVATGGGAAIATHSTVPYNDNESRSMGAVAQALLQKAVHSTPAPSNTTYLYELVELGSLRGVVRVQADVFVGDAQGETLRTLSESLFHSDRDITQEGQGLKPVILRPELDRLSAYGGEQMTQDQCLAAWLALVVCPHATVCSPRICATSHRLLRLEWTTVVQSAAASAQTGQLGEMLEACLLHLLSNAMCLPKGEYLYMRLYGTSTIDVLRQNEAGETLHQLVSANLAGGDLLEYPLIPPKWTPRASQAPYTFPAHVQQSKEQKGNKKHKMRK